MVRVGLWGRQVVPMMIAWMLRILPRFGLLFQHCCLGPVGPVQSGSLHLILGSGLLCSRLNFPGRRFLLLLGSRVLCRPGWACCSWMWVSLVADCRLVVACLLDSHSIPVLISSHFLQVVMMGAFFVGRLLLS